MAKNGVGSLQRRLDPTAQEFRPRTKPNFFTPPPPTHYPYYTSPPPPPPPPYVSSSLPPPSAAPTRTLLLTSVSADVSESLIRRELEVFGEVRSVQMERVGDGIVTVHFYDLRHAELALKVIREQHVHQQAVLRDLFFSSSSSNFVRLPPQSSSPGLVAGRAVWAQFILPSRKAVPDGLNQGTIIVFNLQPTVSTSSIAQIFQAYGPIKEVRETPMKKQQRFVEFYDIRHARKALEEMNGKEIHGKPIVMDFSRPGGFSRKFLGSASPSLNDNHTRHSSQIQFVDFRRENPSDQSNETACSSSVDDGTDHNVKRSWKNAESNEDVTGTLEEQIKSKPLKGRRSKKFDTRFLIKDEAMEEKFCSDSRTTVMIKNIPNKYSQKLLLNMLDNHCINCNEQIIGNGGDNDGDQPQPLSSYDFVYLPIDFNNKCNVGYGFVNMTSPQAAWRLYKAFHHQHWEVFNSKKICEVTYARVQGLEALKEHFKNSKFPSEMDHYLPVIFSPPRDGKQLTDPLPIVGDKQQEEEQHQLHHHLHNINLSQRDTTDQEELMN